MTYKGIKNVRFLLLNSIEDGEINDEADLLGKIASNLNSPDFDLVQDGSDIEIIEFNIICDDTTTTEKYVGSGVRVFHNKIYQIYYQIEDRTKTYYQDEKG